MPQLLHFADHRFNGGTALHAAAQVGNNDIIRMLLHQGGVIDCPDAEGETRLVKAVRNNKSPTVGLLLDRGANPITAIGVNPNLETSDGYSIGADLRAAFQKTSRVGKI